MYMLPRKNPGRVGHATMEGKTIDHEKHEADKQKGSKIFLLSCFLCGSWLKISRDGGYGKSA
jgi:hypothetical protein